MCTSFLSGAVEVLEMMVTRKATDDNGHNFDILMLMTMTTIVNGDDDADDGDLE